MAEVQTPLALAVSIEKTGQSLYNFKFNDFLRSEYRFGVDPTRPQCKAFMQGHCPMGDRCLDRHPAVPSGFGNK
jgi:cleavage and polyadenylation specificity factor subunit 4